MTGPEHDVRLTNYLRTHKKGGGIGVAVAALSGDASTRRYFRLSGPDGTSSIVALYPESFEATATPFYTVGEALIQVGLPLPKLLDHDGALGIYEQEDLGDLTLQHVLADASPTQMVDLYREAIDEIVLVQREASRVPQRAICFQTAFDIEKLSWELHYFEKHFLELHRKVDLSVEDRSKLAEGFHSLAARIASWPRVLCHRDYHSRNLMFWHDRLYVIDFQDARMGPDTYDLVSLLRDSYVDLPDDVVDTLIDDYLAATGRAGEGAAFRKRFDLMALQRNLKALGTFGYQTTTRGNPVYIQYIPRTLLYARNTLFAHTRFATLRDVLSKYITEWQG